MSEELLKQETMADYEDHFDDANPWNMVIGYMNKKTVLHVKIEGMVNGGVIASVEGIRGFIPASQLSLSYVENLDDYLIRREDYRLFDYTDRVSTVDDLIASRNAPRAFHTVSFLSSVSTINASIAFSSLIQISAADSYSNRNSFLL